MKNDIYVFICFFLFCFSQNTTAQWEYITGPNSSNIQSLAISGINLYAAIAGSDSVGIFVSTDDGNSWAVINTGLTNGNVGTLTVNDLKIFASGDGIIYYSTDLGINWHSAPVGSWSVTSFGIRDSNIFAGLWGQNGGGGIYRSTNNGENWEEVYATPTAYSPVTSVIIRDSTIFAGTGPFHGWFLRSNNNGDSWTVVDSSLGGGINALALNGENLISGTYAGVFLSTDDGLNWVPINNGLPDYSHNYGWITTLLVSSYIGGTYFVAGTDSAGVFLSTNNGTTWSSIGLSNRYVYELKATSSGLFAITGTKTGIETLRCPLSEIISRVEDQSNGILSQFILEQNYPNPFNPSTTINFSIPTSGFVTLKVFDVLGCEIATLVNEEKPAGSYEVEFKSHSGEARNLTSGISARGGYASGIYFYKLQTSSFVETKKMILIR